jgi:hypothetical protein
MLRATGSPVTSGRLVPKSSDGVYETANPTAPRTQEKYRTTMTKCYVFGEPSLLGKLTVPVRPATAKVAVDRHRAVRIGRLNRPLKLSQQTGASHSRPEAFGPGEVFDVRDGRRATDWIGIFAHRAANFGARGGRDRNAGDFPLRFIQYCNRNLRARVWRHVPLYAAGLQ